MTDDKEIEAALEAFWTTPHVTCSNHEMQMIRMRAAIAAADKVRAEGFDFIGEGVAIAMKGDQNNADDIADVLRRAFAVGFAKGEAERERVSNERDAAYIAAQIAIAERNAARDQIAKGEADKAALVEALIEARQYDNWAQGRAHITKRIDDALALVRKGV